MKRFFIALVTLLSASQAFANLEVSCVLEDCFSEGWNTYDRNNGQSSMTRCHNFDCQREGWVNSTNGVDYSEAICKNEGCFVEGWTLYDLRTGRMISDVTCQTSFTYSDCLEFGWNTFEPGRGNYVTRCVNGDCRNNGWEVQVPGFAPQPVRCKRGGCFTVGWTIYR